MSLFATSPRQEAIDSLHCATAIYTAEAVIDTLLDKLDWPHGDRRLLDPSAGDGAFLERAALRLLDAVPDITAHRFAAMLHGWEIHPFAADQARQRIVRLLRSRGWDAATATASAKHVVRTADFLTEGPRDGECYHYIAGNPPYLRWLNVPEILRDEYQRVTPDYARADLMHSFIDRCCSVLAPDGEIAMVTADRWLFGERAAKLRAAIGAKTALRHLERLDAATAFARSKQRVKNTPPRVHPVAVVLCRPRLGARSITAAPIYPDAVTEEPDSARTLGDVAEVHLAPLMDKKGCWLLDGAAAATFPPDWLVPAVDSDDIRNGVLGRPRRYVLLDADEPPEVVKQHIASKLHLVPPRMRRVTKPWLPPERWQHFDLSRPSLLVPRIARTLRPIRLPAGILPINHNLSLVATTDEMDLDAIEAALTSQKARHWIERRAPRLENEFLSVTTKLLRRLPLD